MDDLIIVSTNTIKDIIDWLKKGNFVCIHTKNVYQYYFSKETCDVIKGEKIIYVNVSTMPNLLLDGEWPWYIENAGFVIYTSTNVLPADPDNIVFFEI